ncbi:DUF1760-domain-containing protein [Trichodelitschia bisporula]|uniref:DUF1760-domain-containing protein n=1 Tax=Trichodelitschia bisporula TaxID=703511 RepID=A0A6G1HPR2_9PEZI|nr:DUF1760-domain-containing protein [Trichodelitschia bisporula]
MTTFSPANFQQTNIPRHQYPHHSSPAPSLHQFGNMADNQHPFIQLKPPVTDFVTYLTLIEHNLTEANLPLLHEILQDTTVTEGIGWDLVHLLIVLLPASQECLLDVARLGNPREVLLKIAEALRALELDALEEPTEDEEEEEEDGADASADKLVAGASSSQEYPPDTEPKLPLPVLQFRALLDMLSIIHPRIKTKYPSRFLSTTLQGVLSAYCKATMCHDELTHDVVKFVKTVTGTKRPQLPPRVSSSHMLTSLPKRSAPDPEAQAEPPSAEEAEMQERLLQSFLTHLLEDYLLSVSSEDDVPGMAWSARLQEKLRPNHIVPGKPTFRARFAESPALQTQASTVGQLVALAQDLGLSSAELSAVILDPTPESPNPNPEEEEESAPPTSPSSIPLSKPGSLLLLSARKALSALYTQPPSTPPLAIFPTHAALLSNFFGSASRSSIGLEPPALVDAVLFLGLLALSDDNIGSPATDDEFTTYLQSTSVLSANTSSPALRAAAHELTSTVLRSHPSDIVRLAFIRDTLEHCPYENLKASAVSWLKGETVEANPPTASPIPNGGESIFATPVALNTVAPFLFPDLRSGGLTEEPLSEAYMQFRLDMGFRLSALNFYYLLWMAPHLRDALEVGKFAKEHEITTRFLKPLSGAVEVFQKALRKGGELTVGRGEEKGYLGTEEWGELRILDDVLKRTVHVEDVLRDVGLPKMP